MLHCVALKSFKILNHMGNNGISKLKMTSLKDEKISYKLTYVLKLDFDSSF